MMIIITLVIIVIIITLKIVILIVFHFYGINSLEFVKILHVSLLSL